MKVLAVCFVRRPGGEVLCLLCGHVPADQPLAAVPYKQDECSQCARDVRRVAADLHEYWTRTISDPKSDVLTVGELRRRLAGERDDATIYFRDRTFGLLRARSVVGGIVQRPYHSDSEIGHVGPYPPSMAALMLDLGGHIEAVAAVVISDDDQTWEDAKKRGRYPAILPGRVWIEQSTGEVSDEHPNPDIEAGR
jgi:hypothetical protein